MRVTVDTNVLISGTFWSGDSYRILCMVDAGEIEGVLSPFILDEYARVLKSDEIMDKHLRPDISGVVGRVLQKCILVHPRRAVHIVLEDPKDNPILECAVEGKCEILITQDLHLLKLEQFEGIKIVTPATFLRSKSL